LAPREFLHTETLRLVSVQKGDLLNTPLESRFNRIARVARRALDVRAATVSFLDEEREWIKAADGWDLRELALAKSLVALLLSEEHPVVINDTLKDERCKEHRLVTKAPKFRFCAVYPLRDRLEHVIGAVAAYDTEPHQVAADFGEILSDVGQLAQRELLYVEAGTAQEQLLTKLSSARRQAMLDELTRVWNRRGGLQLLQTAIADGARLKQGLGVCIADLDKFKDVNDTHGHSVGDIILKKVAAAMVDVVRPTDSVCRFGGEEFLIIVPGVNVTQLKELMERVRQRVAGQAVRVREGVVRMTLSLGGYVQPSHLPSTPESVLKHADDALYKAKAGGRNVVVAS
jgi:diguanylate cyclase (GGDEF)-like protein